MGGEMGKYVYMVYRTLSYGLSPFLYLHVQCRRLQGLEHPLRWQERFGRPSLPRPPGPLLWFHAVSLGEGMAAIPIIKHCIQQRPDLTILMTTTTTSAFNVIKDRLPLGVIYQFAPLDTPSAMDAFLGYWDPSAIFLIESELWPNLVLGASRKGIVVALLNARMSSKSFKLWSAPVALPLISLMLSRFSLIAPISTIEAIQYQLLQARPFTINFAGDLKYAVGNAEASEQECTIMEDLQLQLANRPVWMAASIHKVMLGAHKVLVKMYSNMLTIIVPRHPWEGRQIVIEVQKEGLNVVLRSSGEKILASTNIYVVDTLGELSFLYKLAPIAVIGGSFLPGLAGHNISEAAAAGCAVLTGHHVGHFSHMVLEMQRSNPLSVMKVSGKLELVEALKELFSNAELLEARRMAAKQSFFALSSGIITNIWNLIDLHVLRKAFLAKDVVVK
ncbi:probable 3-deoxy-D-manno-octulosonic acid transferase, mitochondrial isoform X2 [Macadamia integrifolia]|uniref:probable 3-deoxy-D-manno-octulosonic acid transferase, mitochondrial isoform X2 n=1 Tax=Macadamia integrifolia TaxID=60698 RepID=UPI001C4F56CA|nr:probable 3-deoxy-D-manno-octulosonic acid transferase, mitochondrial isoform X2 [Macadamia integrifolia]